MSFSNELTFKILALVLCDNIYLRVIILSFLLVRIFLRKEKAYKSWCDYFIGVLIVNFFKPFMVKAEYSYPPALLPPRSFFVFPI